MNKLIVIINSKEQILDLNDYCDGIIIGLNKFSVNLPITFSLTEINNIIEICNQNKKQIFITLNKNIHNSDLKELKNTLIELSTKKIDGIIFYDIAIVNLNKDLNLNLNLIWHQEHLVTNYNTINYWHEKGVKTSYLSSELTLEEILEIRNNTNSKLMMNVFGYIPMFTSKRPLVKNYLESFKLEDDSKINYLEKENNIYPITYTDVTTVYSSKILNLVREYPLFIEKKIDYLVLNSFNIDNEKFKKILILFNKTNENNSKENFDKINMLLDYKIDTGFLYKETVYKVKKND